MRRATVQGNDGALARQAVRSGWPETSTLTFDASLLVAGANTVTFTRTGTAGANGLGYDCVVLSIDTNAAPAATAAAAAESSMQLQSPPATAALRVDVELSDAATAPGTLRAAIRVSNSGGVHAMDARLDSLTWVGAGGLGDGGVAAVVLAGRDPSRFPSSLGYVVAGGAGLTRPGGADVEVLTLAAPPAGLAAPVVLRASVSADGGRTRAAGRAAWA